MDTTTLQENQFIYSNCVFAIRNNKVFSCFKASCSYNKFSKKNSEIEFNEFIKEDDLITKHESTSIIEDNSCVVGIYIRIYKNDIYEKNELPPSYTESLSSSSTQQILQNQYPIQFSNYYPPYPYNYNPYYIPQTILQTIPHAIPQIVSMDMKTPSVQQEIKQYIPSNIQNNLPQPIPQALSQNIPPHVPTSTEQGMMQGMPYNMVYYPPANGHYYPQFNRNKNQSKNV